MARWIIWGVGLSYIGNALVMWFAPHFWYENVPGIVEMGLYHKHLIRDVGLVYLVSGAGLLWAFKNPSVAVFAALWPALHALYHIAIFFDRGLPLDIISGTNLMLIQIPAWASLWAALKWAKRT
ncbi:MAG TPA: hypothetical protein ENJ42_02545 [Hellea balneolensis]|uniref:DoxX family protein n=1 Tax=Hellea balneolensis TaxID=287478 RepID=A0A7C5LZA6_9PROT|nr:hypothetical protein [Hellea balneolensis]